MEEVVLRAICSAGSLWRLHMWRLYLLSCTMWQEWQRKSENWDVERRSLQQQIESLRTQNQILAEKCDGIAKTSSDLRSQLEHRRGKIDGTEQSLKAQVAQLSTLLERSKDTISSQVRTSLLWAEAVELCWRLVCYNCVCAMFMHGKTSLQYVNFVTL